MIEAFNGNSARLARLILGGTGASRGKSRLARKRAQVHLVRPGGHCDHRPHRRLGSVWDQLCIRRMLANGEATRATPGANEGQVAWFADPALQGELRIVRLLENSAASKRL